MPPDPYFAQLRSSVLAGLLSSVLVAYAAPHARAQAGMTVETVAPGGRESGPVVLDRATPEQLAANRRSYLARKEMYKLRATYFRRSQNVEHRQLGIHLLGEYTDPATFPALLDVFEDEGEDVRVGLLRHLAGQETDQADAALAWGAVFGPDKEFRGMSLEHLRARVGDRPGPMTERVVEIGLRKPADDTAAAAAHAADTLNLVRLIPLMIQAQVRGGGGAGSGGGSTQEGALAQIYFGQQVAFVSDLQPVVADSAVAFDPELSVITEGTVMRVMDASVVVYRHEVRRSLVSLSSRHWGQSTASLGWDQPAWAAWYHDEFLPAHAAKAASKTAAGGSPAP